MSDGFWALWGVLRRGVKKWETEVNGMGYGCMEGGQVEDM